MVGVGSTSARRTLIIQRDIAANNRRAECAARFSRAFNRFAQLPEIFRLVRIAEIQVVGHGERLRARAGEIARGLGHGDFSAFARIESTIERIAIRRRGQEFIRRAHMKHSGIRTRPNDRAGANRVVILPINPVLSTQLTDRAKAKRNDW